MKLIKKRNLIRNYLKQLILICFITMIISTCIFEDEPVYTELFLVGNSLCEELIEGEETFGSICGDVYETFSIPLLGEIKGNHYAYSLYIEGAFDIEIILVQEEGTVILASWKNVSSSSRDEPVTGEQYSVDPYTVKGDILQLKLNAIGSSCIYGAIYESKIYVPEFQY